jgi:hypothetical protein
MAFNPSSIGKQSHARRPPDAHMNPGSAAGCAAVVAATEPCGGVGRARCWQKGNSACCGRTQAETRPRHGLVASSPNQFPDGAPQRRKTVRTCDFDFSHGVVMHVRFLFVRNLRYKQTEVHGGSPSVGLDSRNASSTEFECRLGYVAVEVGLLASPIQEIGLYSWGLNDKGHFPA